MMRRSIAAIAVVVASAACAHSAATPEVSNGSHPTEFQKSRLLGHYSTLDGKSGFILDRTREPFRARLDGSKTTETLTKQGSVSGFHEFVSADKTIWLRISDDAGEVALFQGPAEHEGVEVVRDADASSL